MPAICVFYRHVIVGQLPIYHIVTVVGAWCAYVVHEHVHAHEGEYVLFHIRPILKSIVPLPHLYTIRLE